MKPVVRKLISALCCCLIMVMALHVIAVDVRADSSGIGDAGMPTDAGDNLTEASPIVPGNYTGYLDSSVDTDDFYAIGLLNGETVSLVLNVPANFNYDLQLYNSTDVLVSSSTNGTGLDEYLVQNIDSDGIWKIRVHHISGSGDGSYHLNISLMGGYDRLTLQVGSVGDDNVSRHLPGIAIMGGTGWASPSGGGRAASVNSSFLLNLYADTYQENAHYQISIAYVSANNVNVSVLMGGVWVQVATLPAESTSWTHSFVLDSSELQDSSSSLLGLNVQLRFEQAVTVSSIEAVPVAYDSDFFSDTPCYPGVMTVSGWTLGGTVVNGSSGATLRVTLPYADGTFFLEFVNFGAWDGIGVQQYDGSNWFNIGSLKTWGTTAVVQLSSSYHDTLPSVPGVSLLIRLTSAAVNLSQVTLWTSLRNTDVGTNGDMDADRAGISLLNNGGWSANAVVDGRTTRTTASTTANFYLNGVLSDTSYAVSIAYKTSSASVSVQQYRGPSSGYVSLGTLTGDGQWQTSTFYTAAAGMYDYVAGAPLNILFQISGPSGAVIVDNIAMCIDRDGDGISDAMESIRVTMAGIGTFTYALNPFSADTDSDGLNDKEEISSYGTNPTNPDTDNDGLLDGSEKYTAVLWSSDEMTLMPDVGSLSFSSTITNFPSRITKYQLLIGVLHDDQTRLYVSMHQAMYLPVGMIIEETFTVKYTGSGQGANLFLSYEFSAIPVESDYTITIGDYTSDGKRGIVQYVKIQVQGTTDPLDSDTDNDDILDGEEVNFGEDGWITNPCLADTDGDGISDDDEINGNTPCGHILDPTNPDTDDDGYSDGVDLYYGDVMLRVTLLEYMSLEKINGGSTRNIFFLISDGEQTLSTKRLSANLNEKAYPNWVYDIDVPETATSASMTFIAVADDAGTLGDDIALDVNPTRNVKETTVSHTLSATASEHSFSGDQYWLDWESDAYMKVRLETKIADKAKVIVINGTGADGDYGLQATDTGSYRYDADDQVYMVNLNVSNQSTHFQQGANTIIIPRAIALRSQLNDTLSDITGSNPFNGSTFHSMNDGSASSHVVVVITKSVNGAMAESMLYMLTHDSNGERIGNNVTISADNVYLLHLPNDVVSSIPTIIQNSGLGLGPNYLGSPLNAITEIAYMAFNFLVYVSNTVVLYLQHLADLGLQALGLLTGAVQDIIDAVNVIVDAFVAFVEWANNMVLAQMVELFSPIITYVQNLIQSYCQKMASLESLMHQEIQDIGYVTMDTIMLMAHVMLGELFQSLIDIAIVIKMIVLAFVLMTGGSAFLISMAASVAMGYILSVIFNVNVQQSFQPVLGGTMEESFQYTVENFTDPEDNYTSQQEYIAFSTLFSIFAIEIGALAFKFDLLFAISCALSLLSVVIGYFSYSLSSYDLGIIGITLAVSSMILTAVGLAKDRDVVNVFIGIMSIGSSIAGIYYSYQGLQG